MVQHLFAVSLKEDVIRDVEKVVVQAFLGNLQQVLVLIGEVVILVVMNILVDEVLVPQGNGKKIIEVVVVGIGKVIVGNLLCDFQVSILSVQAGIFNIIISVVVEVLKEIL